MKIHKSIYIICLAIMLVSCSSNNIEIKMNPIMIHLYSLECNESSTVSNMDRKLNLFVLCNSGKIKFTDNIELCLIYKKLYKNNYITFEAFMTDAINQKIKINENEFLDNKFTFKLDNAISESYQNFPFNKFIDKYFEKYSNNILKLKSEYHKDYLYTILYYCFINNCKVDYKDSVEEYFMTPNYFEVN